MTGDRELWVLRRGQHKPEAAWVVDGDSACARNWAQNPYCLTGEVQPEIEIAETDIPETLDLRCLVGMTVHVCALRGEGRARRLHAAIVDAKAHRVITSIHSPTGVELLLHGVANG